jgi:hypothetical protein
VSTFEIGVGPEREGGSEETGGLFPNGPPIARDRLEGRERGYEGA